jgi:Putative viral replication protein./RNA helicase.
MSRVRNWCFTLNNWNTGDITIVENVECEYVIVGRETAETGTHHLQGYIEFDRPRRLGYVRKIFSERAHWEPRRGTAKQASDYCRKEDPAPIERGTISTERQGKRSDILAVTNHISVMNEEGNMNTHELAVNFPREFVKYHRGFNALMTALVKPPRWRNVTVNVLYGETGTGKSRYLSEHVTGSFYYIRRGVSGIWWDQYFGQRNVIFDDFDGSWIKYREFLRLADGHPYYGDVKGSSHVAANWRTVWISADRHPRDWWEIGEAKWSQLERRLTRIVMYRQGEDPVYEKGEPFPEDDDSM